MRRTFAVFAAAFTIALAFAVASVAVAGGCETPAGTTEGTGLAISVKGCAFGPTILHTPIGATVSWKNDDYLPHAINGGGWTATPGGVQANPGMTVSYKFDRAGIYPYMCYIHPGMAGIVVVGDVAFPGNAPAPSAPLTQPAPVELPIALALVFGAVLGSIATARWPRRWRVALPSWSV
jgi:plastocyanin